MNFSLAQRKEKIDLSVYVKKRDKKYIYQYLKFFMFDSSRKIKI